MVFSGTVNISFTHACTIKNSSSDIVFNNLVGTYLGLAPCLVLFNVLCDFLTGECATQPALRATSGSVCVDFELGDIWGAQQLRTGCLSILMFLAPLAEVTP